MLKIKNTKFDIELEYIRGLKPSLSQICSLVSFLQLLLSFSKFCQVESSNFLGLFNLLFIRFDLGLQFVGQIRHAVLALLVLLYLERQFLAASLGLLVSLGGLRASCLTLAKLHFKFSNARLQLSHSYSSSSNSIVISLSKLHFKLRELAFQG